jgi:hypothetical protein
MPLAPSCRHCAFYQPNASRCRRHAPSLGFEELELPYWPLVKPADRCGASAPVRDGSETVSCGRCVHWFQPDGVGIRPDYRQGMSVAWWEQSGFCTKFAPTPSNDEERTAHWRVTHVSDRCGDGEEAKPDPTPLLPL